MKKVVFIILALFFLTSCDKKIDGSSEKAFQESAEVIIEKLKEEDRYFFESCLNDLFMVYLAEEHQKSNSFKIAYHDAYLRFDSMTQKEMETLVREYHKTNKIEESQKYLTKHAIQTGMGTLGTLLSTGMGVLQNTLETMGEEMKKEMDDNE